MAMIRSLRPTTLLLAGLLAAPLAADEPDPIQGMWLGTATSATERIVVGLEFRRGEAGALELLLTQPVANVYGMAVEAPVVRDGESVAVAAAGLALTLRGDSLIGSFPDPETPARFERVESLPAELPAPDLPRGPEPRWRLALAGRIFASPTVADGVAYVGTTGGLMHAVRASDGQPLWVFRTGKPILGAALVEGEAVYFVCDDGFLYRVTRATGEEVWRYELGDAATPRVPPHPFVFDWDWQGPRPAIADGVLFVGAGDGSFHAVDAAGGGRRWRVATGAAIRNGAAIAGTRVVFGAADGVVRALDRASGAEIWRHAGGAPVDAAPVVAGERILVADRGTGLIALDSATGARLWTSSFWGSWVESTPVVVDGVIYIGSSDLRRVSALDPGDGRVLWRTDVFGWSWGTPLVAGDRIYVGTAGGSPYWVRHEAGFAILDRDTGRLLARRPHGDSSHGFPWGFAGSAARAGDLAVAATVEGELIAFPLR